MYFVACFFPLQIFWVNKMFFASRVLVHDDVYHRMYDFATLIILGSAVLHIRTVEILSDSQTNRDMFAMCFSFSVMGLLSWARSIEVYFKGIGQPAIKNAMRRDIFWVMPTFLCFFVAAGIAGSDYLNSDKSTTYNSSYPKSDDHAYEEYPGNSTKDDTHRLLAGTDESSSYATYTNDLPVYFMIAGSLLYILSIAVMILVLPKGEKHKE